MKRWTSCALFCICMCKKKKERKKRKSHENKLNSQVKNEISDDGLFSFAFKMFSRAAGWRWSAMLSDWFTGEFANSCLFVTFSHKHSTFVHWCPHVGTDRLLLLTWWTCTGTFSPHHWGHSPRFSDAHSLLSYQKLHAPRHKHTAAHVSPDDTCRTDRRRVHAVRLIPGNCCLWDGARVQTFEHFVFYTFTIKCRCIKKHWRLWDDSWRAAVAQEQRVVW